MAPLVWGVATVRALVGWESLLRRHRLAAVLALAVAVVECGGAPAPPGMTPVVADVGLMTAPATDVRYAPSVTPVVRMAPKPWKPAVSPLRPDLRIDDVPPDAQRLIADLDGVRATVMVGSFEVAAPTADGLEPVDALVVRPRRFRRFTPDVTANEIGVWERLSQGNIVLTTAAANRIGAVLGETATLSGPRGTEALRVGAVATNGLPQLADVLVTPEVGKRLGRAKADTLLVAVDESADPARVMARVVEAVGGTPRLLEEPEVRHQAPPGAVGRTTFRPFTYQSLGDGTIRMDPSWVAQEIVTVDMPIVGRVTCHHNMVDQMAAALREIQAAGLADEIYDYAGCWVPRHILWDPSRGISKHAWGLAFDINVPTNEYGVTPSLHAGIVDAFRRWGFKWGGDFSPPDGMHFELERLIDM